MKSSVAGSYWLGGACAAVAGLVMLLGVWGLAGSQLTGMGERQQEMFVAALSAHLDMTWRDYRQRLGGLGGQSDGASSEWRRAFPSAWNVRLLAGDLDEPDDSSTPPLSYAHLALLREARKGDGNPPPVAIAGGSEQAHIALLRRVSDEAGGAGGYLMVFLPMDALSGFFRDLGLSGSYVQLLQPVSDGQDQVVVAVGDPDVVAGADPLTRSVPGTRWTLAYWPDPEFIAVPGGFVLGLAALGLLLLLLLAAIFFVLRRKYVQRLLDDQAVLVTLVRDFTAGGLRDNYPVSLREFQGAMGVILDVLRAGTGGKGPAKRNKPVTRPVSEEPKEAATPDLDL